ncbi:uncharacterized protein fam217ba isoform X2 [Takifugu rubripes]|uniref:Family with sequence similarity 217 member B n=3 Tax=Takifugu rubripes TaxID=31033 RepID=A0A3B5KFH7_TAKRU|nr:protein FAM217B isoform X2 [Takifugu rubripes]|eukprot:XP_011600663.1 PREDICTED: protein FAM217B [Takifugu rubripes]
MGPIMQERTASTALKCVVPKDKIRIKASEINASGSSSKKGSKMKKTVGQIKNGLPGAGQDKDTVTAVQRGMQSKGGRVKSGTIRNSNKLTSPDEEGDLRPQLRKHLSVHRKEERCENQRMSKSTNELLQHRIGMGKNRRDLSLPLSPISGLRHIPGHPLIHSPAPSPEVLQQHFNQKDVDSDSASDLSDSERLPVLPSPCTPCTPPHLNLRAEVITTHDFPPDFPGPCGAADDGDDGDDDESGKPSYTYPDFLPPPFNSWSLRQLALFLHTEGRGAPRPKPVGPLEKYLERLLQLEWVQIQTVQAESTRQHGTRSRPQSLPSAPVSHPPRPHTAPSSRLNSPKGLRHSQRGFPFTPVNNPPSPASVQQQQQQQQHSRIPVCPHCHIRYPLCNGSCSAYAYQRHSRLSPLLERRARPGAPAKRSSSETRISTEGRSPGGPGNGGGAQTPVSPSGAKSHLRQMHAAGNARKQPQDTGSNTRVLARKSRVRANSETDVKKESDCSKAATVEKHPSVGSKRELLSSKKMEKDSLKTKAGAQASKTALKRAAKDPQTVPKAPPINKQNSKTKTVHFDSK